MAHPNDRTGMGAQLADAQTWVTCKDDHDKRPSSSGGITWDAVVVVVVGAAAAAAAMDSKNWTWASPRSCAKAERRSWATLVAAEDDGAGTAACP